MPFTDIEKRKKSQKKYRDKNKEKIALYLNNYKRENKEKIKEYNTNYSKKEKTKEAKRIRQKRYDLENKDKRKEYRINNKETISLYSKELHKRNPERSKLASAKRRALKKCCCGSLSKGITEKLMVLQRGKCAVCKQSVKDGHHLDHIMPLSLGGSNTDDNIQILCPSCNLSKGAKHPQDFMIERGFLL